MTMQQLMIAGGGSSLIGVYGLTSNPSTIPTAYPGINFIYVTPGGVSSSSPITVPTYTRMRIFCGSATYHLNMDVTSAGGPPAGSTMTLSCANNDPSRAQHYYAAVSFSTGGGFLVTYETALAQNTSAYAADTTNVLTPCDETYVWAYLLIYG